MLFEETPLLLEFDAEGYPVPWVAWIWNDQVLQTRTDEATYLFRSNVTMEEAGNYTCMAGNSAGSSKYTFQVSVKGERFHVQITKMYRIFALSF